MTNISTSSFEMPLVSIIVPTYNYGHFIKSAIASIQAQTYNNWECIVVDDGSTDNTKKIVNSIGMSDNRVKYVYQENRYQAAAKNTGVSSSKGKYIQFLDADDMLEPNKLENQVEFMEQNGFIDITYSETRYFSTDDLSARWYFMHVNDAQWIPQIRGVGSEIIKQIIKNNFLTINSPLIRRSVVDDTGSFDENLKLVEDWDFWIRCCLKEKHIEYKNWDGSLALVRSHSTSYSRNRQQVNASTILMREKLRTLIKEHEIVLLNESLLSELKEWTENVKLTAENLESWIKKDQPFILVDDDQIRIDLSDFKIVPFTESNGEYFGPPADSEVAITELERLRIQGASFIVFAWMSFWWLEYYQEFKKYLRSNFVCILEDERLIVFKL